MALGNFGSGVREAVDGARDAFRTDVRGALLALRSIVHKLSMDGVVTGTLDLYRAGGGRTGDHVDVLLNLEFMSDTIDAASGLWDNKKRPNFGDESPFGCMEDTHCPCPPAGDSAVPDLRMG